MLKFSSAEFVYLGEVSVSQTMLQSFLKTAGLLRIRGLADDTEETAAPQPADIYGSKRKRKPSKEKEDILRKRKSTVPGGGGSSLEHGGGLEPAAAKLHCGAGASFSGGLKNGGAADLLAGASGSSVGGSEELMLKQEPLDPGAYLNNNLYLKKFSKLQIKNEKKLFQGTVSFLAASMKCLSSTVSQLQPLISGIKVQVLFKLIFKGEQNMKKEKTKNGCRIYCFFFQGVSFTQIRVAFLFFKAKSMFSDPINFDWTSKKNLIRPKAENRSIIVFNSRY
jgi:hypothetical protein